MNCELIIECSHWAQHRRPRPITVIPLTASETTNAISRDVCLTVFIVIPSEKLVLCYDEKHNYNFS